MSTRVRVGRSIEGFLFPPLMSKDQRLELEQKVSNSLKKLTGELSGTYYPLKTMSDADRRQLVDDHFLFKNDDP